MEHAIHPISIDQLLTLMEGEEPEAIELNHMVIEDNADGLLLNQSIQQLPCFTVQFGGFVDVEIYMTPDNGRVTHLCVRQTAMTFEELEANGDILPSLTIACNVLSVSERDRLDTIAKVYVLKGNLKNKVRAEDLLTHYVGKVMFCSKKYGNMSKA